MAENLTHVDTFNGTEWTLEQFYVPQLVISPPPDQTGLIADPMIDKNLPWGTSELQGQVYHRIIDQQLHEELLAQSIEEYGEIWKILAQM